MKRTLFALVILAGSAFAADISIGIQIGAPPPPRVVAVLPAQPGPDFVWITGYWYPLGGHYRWHEGYWTRPPYDGAIWVAPRHDGQRFFEGYWEGEHGRFAHDHHWDGDHDRRDRDRFDHDRSDHDRGRGRGHDRDDHDDHDRR